MSVEALAVVLHHSRARGTDKLVLVGIANHDGDGGAWPSVDTLARYANFDERSVRRSLQRLQSSGEVLVHVQAGGPSGIPEWRRPNRYEVLVECPATCDRTRNHRSRPLPAAPADLWINPLTPASPPDASVPPPPDASVPPPPDASVPLTIQENHPVNPAVVSPSQPQSAREPLCWLCSRLKSDCERRVAVSGHEFTPVPEDDDKRSNDEGAVS